MRLLVILHRWLGIGLCLFFAMWFASGMVMMFVPFPSLPEQDRLGFLAPVNSAAIGIAPARAVARCGGVDLAGLRLLSIQGRPAYVCHSTSGPATAVYADDGTAVTSAVGAGDELAGPFDYDQWVVHQRFDPYRPFYRQQLQDDAGTELYISSRTGEVLQRTTSRQRAWNYAGAVVHWIYPTVLRKDWALWDQTVWWLSLAGIISVLVGLYLGVKAFIRARHSGRAMLSPYRGWLRWHHSLGLVVGVMVLSWIVSGWLSMDHGRLFSTPDPTAAQVAAFRGMSLAELAAEISRTDLQAVSGAKEISFHAFAGRPFLVSAGSANPAPPSPVTEVVVAEAVRHAWPNVGIIAITTVPENDTYTSLREGSLPRGSLRIELNDGRGSWIHVHPDTGEILSVMDRSRRAYRWLYNGLHSLDFPGLVDRRALWISVMSVLLLSGLVFSGTGVVLAVRHLRRL